jgi:hypothetical protein
MIAELIAPVFAHILHGVESFYESCLLGSQAGCCGCTSLTSQAFADACFDHWFSMAAVTGCNLPLNGLALLVANNARRTQDLL